MKPYLFLLCLLLFGGLIGQESRLEPDASWEYGVFAQGFSGKDCITNSNRDTLVKDTSYKILNRKLLKINQEFTGYDTMHIQPYLVRSDSCCFYLYSHWDEREFKITDFELTENDTVDFLELRHYSDYSINVASIRMIPNNGDSIRLQNQTVVLNDYPEDKNRFGLIVLDNIGNTNMNFNSLEIGDPWGDIPYYDLCTYNSKMQDYDRYENSRCQLWDEIIESLSTSTGNSEAYNIEVYPNPFSNRVFVDDPDNRIDKIEVRDMSGQLIKRTNGKSVIQIDSSNSELIFIAFDSEGKVVKKEILFSF